MMDEKTTPPPDHIGITPSGRPSVKGGAAAIIKEELAAKELDTAKCVKCGHNVARDKHGHCLGFIVGQTKTCGCKCEFPAPVGVGQGNLAPLDAELKEIKRRHGYTGTPVTAPLSDFPRLIEMVEQQQREIGQINERYKALEEDFREAEGEPTALRERVKELEAALRGLRDILGHTMDCPEGTNQKYVLGYLTTMPQECSKLCVAARAALEKGKVKC